MEHRFFARFARPEDARRVLRDLRESRLHHKVSIDVVPDIIESTGDMPPRLNNVPAAIGKGIVGGGLGGLVLGIIFGLVGLGPLGMTAALAAIIGAIAGTLGAVLIGAQDPDQNLERCHQKLGPGEVILAFHAPDLTLEEELVGLVRRAGGDVVPRAGVKATDDMAVTR
jgi:uncharacterized membrane protein